ncbi:MAG: CHAD domain-containing protein [Jaaginema sp. PMC 1079.18]|nr:CHAD domain-containing protein [Jaaginema sp. PMC 1080.18]MEC4853789.1 CHAD domain-containing protein [Jaaginema sp. PMC 1079.18]MEC4865716.1 CHAD domain-containing protein [Jaaginema sp. PMC 1078.18]
MTQKLQLQTTTTFGDWAYLAINRHYHKMLKHEAGVLQDRDPEELHQMRVGMRRLRTAIAGFAPAIRLPKAAREKQVALVARILGKLRDLDVLQATLTENYYPVLPPAEQKQLQKALKKLKKERKTQFIQVETLLQDKVYVKLKTHFERWLHTPQYQSLAEVNIDWILPDLLLPQTSKLLLHPGWLVGLKIADGEFVIPELLEPQDSDNLLSNCDETLHSLRKEAKRSRYQMELFEQFYGEEYGQVLKNIKKIQSILGNIQDGSVLTDFLNQALQIDLTQKMPILAAQLQRDRLEHWQEWQVLQSQFLDASWRKNLRHMMQHPQSESFISTSHPDDSKAKNGRQPDQ